MKFWQYIELDDGIGHGLTEKGHPFWELEIQGWNDNETFTDLTDLISVRGTLFPGSSELDIEVSYSRSELKNDLMIRKLIDQAKSDLQAAASAFRQTD